MLKKMLKSNSLRLPLVIYQNNKVFNSLYQSLNKTTSQLIYCNDIYKFSTKKQSKIEDDQIHNDEISGEKLSEFKIRRALQQNESFPSVLNRLNKKSIIKGMLQLVLNFIET